MLKSKQNSTPCVVNEYNHWFLNHFRSVLPKDFMIIERTKSWPPVMSLIANIYCDTNDVKCKVDEYKVEWIQTDIPQTFDGHVRDIWKTTEGILDRDSSYWEFLEKKL